LNFHLRFYASDTNRDRWASQHRRCHGQPHMLFLAPGPGMTFLPEDNPPFIVASTDIESSKITRLFGPVQQVNKLPACRHACNRRGASQGLELQVLFDLHEG
jgi:hypothetical protein